MDDEKFQELQINIQDMLELYDTSFNNTVASYLKRAINYVKTYCNLIDIPTDLETVVEDIAIFNFRMKGIENIQSESKGSLSENYRQSLPNDIVTQLNKYRQVKVL